MDTITLLKQFCSYVFEEGNCDMAVSLLAENIFWVGVSDGAVISSKSQARNFIENSIINFHAGCSVEYIDARSLPCCDGQGSAFLRLRLISSAGSRLDISVTAESRLYDDNDLICFMHFSDSECFSDVSHGCHISGDREALVLSTMAGGLMGGYCDPGFPFYFINSHMLKYLGYDSEKEFTDNIGGLIENVMHPDDREMVDRVTRSQLADSGHYSVDYRMRKKDGSYIRVHDIGKLGADENGRPVIVSVCYDISSEHEKEQELANIINAIPGGVAIYKISDIFETVYFSDGVPALSGYTVEEYNKLICGDAAQMTHPDDREMVVRELRYACTHNTTADFIFRKVHRDGHTVWVHLQGNKIGEDGGCPLIQCVFHNISSQKEQEMLNHHLLNSITGGVIIYEVIDNHLHIVQSSEGICNLTGHTQEEYIKICGDGFGLVYDQDIPIVKSAFEQLLHSDEPVQTSHHIRHKDGRLLGVHMNARVIGHHSGHPLICAVFMKMSDESNMYQLIAQKSSDGIYIISKETYSVLYMNAQAKHTFQIDDDVNVSCLPCYELLRKCGKRCEDCAIFKNYAEGTTYELYIPHLKKHLQGTAYSLNWAGIPAYVVYISDITLRKADEHRRVASEKNLTVAVSHTGIYYWEITDFDKRIIHTNKYVQEQFGVGEYCENYPDHFLSLGFVAPENCEAYRNAVRRIYDGESYSQFDACIKTKFHGYVWMRVRITRIDEPGEKPRAVCTAEEIAEYKELEQRVITIMHQNRISSWRYDIKRRLIVANGQSYHAEDSHIFFGEKSPAELTCYLHPDDVQPWLNFHSNLADSPEETELVVRIHPAPSQPYRYIRCRYTLMPDRNGVPTYALGSCVDITEQVRQEERYESAMHTRYDVPGKNVMMVGHCNITNDTLLEIEDFTGLELQKRFGTSRNKFFTGFGTLIPDETQRKAFYSATLSDSLITDFSLGISQHDANFMIFIDKKKHELCWLSLHIDTVEQPGTGDLMGFVTITDITSTKQQEQMLETVARRNYDYISYVNLLEDSMILYRHRDLKDEASTYLTGQSYCLSEAMKYSAEHYVVPEDKEMYVKQSSVNHLLEQLKTNDSYEFAFHLTENGRIRAKRMRIDVLDRIAGTAVMTRSDVTEVVSQQDQQRKNLSEALEIAESANRHKTEFLSSMSHDIRTPMNAIVGMCALALENEDDAVQVHESLKTIQSSSQILLSLINNILNMSRIESGKMVLQETPFSLLSQVHDTADSYRVLAHQKRQQFQLYTNIRHDSCLGDISRIHSAVDNVLSNAIKYTPEGGTVIYRVSELPSDNPDIGLYRFEISDTGVGISEDEQQHIFEPFFRGESERTSSIQGTGLGLPITKQIVELKGGTISVSSSPNVGTTFVIELPLHFCSESAIPAHEKDFSRPIEHDFTGIHILLCEDHPVNQKVVTRILEKVNAHVTLTANGKEGFEKFKASAPGSYHLILMDIRMPVMDGYAAASAIRTCSHPQAKTIPIVALSANAFTEDVQKSMQHGMNAHIAKPVVPEKLYSTIEAFCGNISQMPQCRG